MLFEPRTVPISVTGKSYRSKVKRDYHELVEQLEQCADLTKTDVTAKVNLFQFVAFIFGLRGGKNRIEKIEFNDGTVALVVSNSWYRNNKDQRLYVYFMLHGLIHLILRNDGPSNCALTHAMALDYQAAENFVDEYLKLKEKDHHGTLSSGKYWDWRDRLEKTGKYREKSVDLITSE